MQVGKSRWKEGQQRLIQLRNHLAFVRLCQYARCATNERSGSHLGRSLPAHFATSRFARRLRMRPFLLLPRFVELTALDQIMAERPKKTGGAGRNSQRGRRGGRSSRPGAKAAALGSGAQNAAVIAASNRNKPPVVIPGRSGNTGSKIILSNLPLDVTEAQVKVRFSHPLSIHGRLSCNMPTCPDTRIVQHDGNFERLLPALPTGTLLDHHWPSPQGGYELPRQRPVHWRLHR